MKQLKEYINEGLLSRKVSIKTPIKFRPTNRTELMDNILELLKKGITNLNCIDVSKIDDMSFLFWAINKKIQVKDIDISEWDVSNVTDMLQMFYECSEFNSDLSNWDVSKVTCTRWMFSGCKKFNSDLSKWDVTKDASKRWMFSGCDTLEKNNKIPDWYTGTV